MLNWDEYGKEENVTPQSTPTVNNEVVKQAAEVVAEEKPTIQKIDKAEGVINWNDKADIILGKINGLSPSPGAFFTFDGERYKVLKAEISNGLGIAGEVLNDKLEIACSHNKSLKILEIQRQGKKPQKINEFMLGSRIKKGTLISHV